MIPHYERKFTYLWTRQGGWCPIARSKDRFAQPTELHHRAHDTETNRKLYPLFLNSVWNLQAVNHDCHMERPSFGKISWREAERRGAFLRPPVHRGGGEHGGCMSVERQELYCHNCDRYVQFNMDLSMDGNHVFACPRCGHEHCRVVKNGQITGIRWDQRNGPTIPVPRYTITYTITSTYDTSTSGSTWAYQVWTDTGSAT